MSKFDDCYISSGLKSSLDPIVFTQEAADMLIEICAREPVPFPMIFVTHRCEAWPSFSIIGPPNTNKRDDDHTKWDIGPFQLNWESIHADIAMGNIKAADLPDDAVFGKVFYEADGKTPAKF